MSDFETITRDPKEFGDRLLHLKNNKKFCDAEIVVDKIRIAVHKNILVSSSTYFEEKFLDASMAKVEIENMNVKIVQSLLDYCYTGNIKVSERNMKEVMLSAKFFKLTSVFKDCEEIFENKMDSSNCISTWIWAESQNLENLKEIAFKYARQNFEKVSQSPDFMELNDSGILELLTSDIVVSNEYIVLRAVQKWINHNEESRKRHLDKLSHCIKFEHLPKYILKSSDLQSFFNSSIACLNKILDALRWKTDHNRDPYDGNPRDSYNINTFAVVGSEKYNVSKTMEIFDLQSEKWTKVENFECNRIIFSAAVLENKLMLIGGETNKDIIVNTVQSYDLSTGTMENLPPMKYARYRLSAVEFKGRVYAIGGLCDKKPLACVEMWDPVLKTWKELAPMSIPRNGCEAIVLGEEIFVVGGGTNGNYLSDTESYNPDTDKWTKRASMNEKRYGFGVTVIGGYLYAVGGCTGVDLNTAERYDHKIDKWTTIHSLENAKSWMGAGKLSEKFVIMGGSSNKDDNLSTMEMYDDENDNWISMPSINVPRFFLRAVEIPWRLAKAALLREIPN